MFGTYQIIKIYREYHEGSSTYDDLDIHVELPEELKNSTPELPLETQFGETETNDLNWPMIDFESLSSINSDIVGWLYIEGTKINYPIVQGEDNSYYLKHLFDGKYNSSGCIFLDTRNNADFSDRHSVIYGHNMRDGSMFAGLTKYKKQAYYDEHPIALLVTPGGNYRIEFFAGYVASNKDDAWKISFFTDEEFEVWLNQAVEKSCFTSTVSPAVTDKIITLSTCSYEFDDAKFVLLGRVK